MGAEKSGVDPAKHANYAKTGRAESWECLSEEWVVLAGKRTALTAIPLTTIPLTSGQARRRPKVSGNR